MQVRSDATDEAGREAAAGGGPLPDPSGGGDTPPPTRHRDARARPATWQARLNLREKLGIEWTGSGSLMVRKVFGQAKRLGVQAGWVATGIDGVALKDADDHLDAFKERLAARQVRALPCHTRPILPHSTAPRLAQAQRPPSASASMRVYVTIAFCGTPRWEWEDDHRSFQA